MTLSPDDLAAIRARDAAPYGVSADVVRLIEDRRALLAEVDRLTRENATIPPDVHVWGLATDTERARSRAAVEGLPVYPGPRGMEVMGGYVRRAAVLAAIDGADHD